MLKKQNKIVQMRLGKAKEKTIWNVKNISEAEMEDTSETS